MNFRFDGININSQNPHEVFEFYKKLGFRVLETADPESKWYGAALALQEDVDAPKIWIWNIQEGDAPIVNQFVFDTGDRLDELYEQFMQKGISCKPPHTAEWGGKELILTDPAGNTLLFL